MAQSSQPDNFFSSLVAPSMSLAPLQETLNSALETHKWIRELERERRILEAQDAEAIYNAKTMALKYQTEGRLQSTAEATEQRQAAGDTYKMQKDQVDLSKGIDTEVARRQQTQGSELRSHVGVLRNLYNDYNAMLKQPAESDYSRKAMANQRQLQAILDALAKDNNNFQNTDPDAPSLEGYINDNLKSPAPAMSQAYLSDPHLREWAKQYVKLKKAQLDPAAPGTDNPYVRAYNTFVRNVSSGGSQVSADQIRQAQQNIVNYLMQDAPMADVSGLQDIWAQSQGIYGGGGASPGGVEDPGYLVGHTGDGQTLGIYHKQHGRVRLGTIGKDEVWVSPGSVGGTMEGSNGKVVMPRRGASREDMAAIQRFNSTPGRVVTMDTPLAIIGKQAEALIQARRKAMEPPEKAGGKTSEAQAQAANRRITLGDVLGWPVWLEEYQRMMGGDMAPGGPAQGTEYPAAGGADPAASLPPGQAPEGADQEAVTDDAYAGIFEPKHMNIDLPAAASVNRAMQDPNLRELIGNVERYLGVSGSGSAGAFNTPERKREYLANLFLGYNKDPRMRGFHAQLKAMRYDPALLARGFFLRYQGAIDTTPEGG